MSGPSLNFVLPFLKKDQVAKDTFSFSFKQTQPEFDFLPGQYIRMTLPHNNADDRGTSRFFTISSSPLDRDILCITTKITEHSSSFKKRLAALKQNEQVQFYGPMGKFILSSSQQEPQVFIAGGIGITPFHSMLTSLALKETNHPIKLFVAFSTVEEIVFYEELMKIAKIHMNIQIIYTITKLERSQKEWHGETGRINEGLLKKYIGDIMQPTYYIVGPEAMVEETKVVLESMGITEEKIVIEIYPGY